MTSDPVGSAATAGPCYEWPTVCGHRDHLECMDAEQRAKHPGWDRLCERMSRRFDQGHWHPAEVKPAFRGRRHAW